MGCDAYNGSTENWYALQCSALSLSVCAYMILEPWAAICAYLFASRSISFCCCCCCLFCHHELAGFALLSVFLRPYVAGESEPYSFVMPAESTQPSAQQQQQQQQQQYQQQQQAQQQQQQQARQAEEAQKQSEASDDSTESDDEVTEADDEAGTSFEPTPPVHNQL